MSGAGSTLADNERIKLTATAVSNLGMAIIVAAFAAPAISGQLHGGWRALVTLAWSLFGVALHWAGRRHLGRLQP